MVQPRFKLQKYSIGVGDRFAQQAEAQLRACVLALEAGVEIIPVWNKSNREHQIIGSNPATVRAAAAAAVEKLRWTRPWHVDADHIRIETVDHFIACSDFFTIDVADSIGEPASAESLAAFVDRHPELAGPLDVPNIEPALRISRDDVSRIAGKYLFAVHEVGRIYRHIASLKGSESFISEVSMDETEQPQTPLELLIILVALADEQVPLQTIAPKFTGRFNKGVDYVGDIAQFEKEFNDDLAVVRFAVDRWGLPDNLKLSIHSGSDKFYIYGPIRRALARHQAGLHLKTAGTTWLEELIGLAETGGAGLEQAKEIYRQALAQIDDLCAPYANVIDIKRSNLPAAATVANWSAEQFVTALRHVPGRPAFNPDLRQLLHVGYKVAAKMGRRYLDVVQASNGTIARNVTENLFARHLKPLFLG
jgi:hypothetical protein